MYVVGIVMGLIQMVLDGVRWYINVGDIVMDGCRGGWDGGGESWVGWVERGGIFSLSLQFYKVFKIYDNLSQRERERKRG